MVMAKPLTVVLLGAQYENAWFYLTFLAITQLTFGLGKSHLWRLLTGQGQTKLVAKLEGLAAAVAVCLGILLIPAYGILGLIAASFTANWPSYLIAVSIAHRSYGIKPPLKSVWRIYVLAMLTALPMILLLLTKSNDVIKIIIGVVAGLGIYIIAAPLLKAVGQNDIDFLINIVRPQPVIGSIICKILQVMERIIKWRHSFS